MKIAIVIYSNDPETAWNAFRFANTALAAGDEVKVFLLGKGVEVATINTLQYDVLEQIQRFRDKSGQMIGCGVCCETRLGEMPYLLQDLKCEVGTMKHLYALIAEADKVLTF